MLGYDMSWASFHVLEVMSSSKFHLKSVGYLAAVQSFNQDTDVLMLAPNLLKKVSRNPLSISKERSSSTLTGHYINALRYCSRPQWNISYCNPRPCSGPGLRNNPDAKSLSSTHTEESHSPSVQGTAEVPRSFINGHRSPQGKT